MRIRVAIILAVATTTMLSGCAVSGVGLKMTFSDPANSNLNLGYGCDSGKALLGYPFVGNCR